MPVWISLSNKLGVYRSWWI